MSITLSSKELLSKEQAAAYLEISLSTLNNYIKNNVLTPVKVGGKVRITKSDLSNLIVGAFSNSK